MKTIVSLVVLLISTQLYASEDMSSARRIRSSVNPAKFERTAAMGKKLIVSLPVTFSKEVCVEHEDVWVDKVCSYYSAGFYGGYYGRFGYGYGYGYAVPIYVGPSTYSCGYTQSVCKKTEIQSISKMTDVVIKFRKNTLLSGKEVELYSLKAEQAGLGSHLVEADLEQVNTIQAYNIHTRHGVFSGETPRIIVKK